MTLNESEKSDIRDKAVKGAAWSAIDKFGGQAFSFLTFLILARLLEPQDIGLIAIATLVVAFMQIFIDRGLAEAIIQRATITGAHLDTAFWINIFVAIVLTLLTFLFKGLIAGVYNEPYLKPILAWLSINFILAAFSSTQQAILRRNLNFRGLAIRRLLAQLIGGIVGVSMALFGFGAWSLVAQNLVYSSVGVIVLWQVSDWRPKLAFSKDCFKDLFSFGIHILGNSIVTFATGRLDEFFIGTFLGSVALGYYKVAYRLLRMIIEILTQVATSVLLPIYSRFQSDFAFARTIFYKSIQLASLISSPICLGLGILVPDLIQLLFGAKWLPAIPTMRILLFIGFLQPITGVTVSLVQSMGKPAWIFVTRSISVVVAAILFYALVNGGGRIEDVAWGQVFMQYAAIPVFTFMVHRLVPLDFKRYFKSLILPIIASGLMGIITVVLRTYLVVIGNVYVELILLFIAGVVTYILFIRLLCRKCFEELIYYSNILLRRVRRVK